MHGNYLTPTTQINGWSLLGLILRTSTISLIAYFTLLSTLMLVPMWLGIFKPVTWLPQLHGTPLQLFLHNYCWLATLIAMGAFIVQCLWFAIFLESRGNHRYSAIRLERTRKKRLGRLLTIITLSFLVGSIPWLHQLSLELLLSLKMTEGYEIWKMNASEDNANLAEHFQRIQG